MKELWHNHFMDGCYHPECKRCKVEQAAPELLEALKAIPMDCMHNEKDHIDACWVCKATQAINKAEGRI